jgi:outer membrane protein OmpA-like peptidoglycan-associated protein
MRTRVLWAAAAVALTAGRAGAADDPARRDFDVDPSRPAALASGAFAVETAEPQGRGTGRVELLLDYARGLLALREGDRKAGDLLRDRLSLHALGSWSLGAAEVGAHLPVALSQGSDLGLLAARGVTGPLAAPIAATALGDLRLVAKAPLPLRLPLDLAALVDLRLPTGDGQAFLSDGLAVNPQLAAGRRLGPVRLDANVGWLFRGAGQYLQLVARDALTYGLAAQLPFPPAGPLRRWTAIADVAGQWPRGADFSTARYQAPLSARAGLRAGLWKDLGFDVGAGTGLGGDAGYGRESFRVFAGLRWERLVPAATAATPAADRDGDGVPDERDRCPDQKGPAELDGCPDRDGDLIPDPEDRCPDEKGAPQYDGCPPPAGEPIVEIETDRLSLKDAITFDTGRDTIRPESNRILEEIARVLTANPQLTRIRVEGHTDNVGGKAYNQDLSQRRARAVVRALAQRGVAAGRLEPQGYGFDRPVASNGTALGRAKNRRVEFTILAESGKAR